MEKKDKCCTPKGQVPRYVDCIGCDKKPIETMSKQTAVEWLGLELNIIFHDITSELWEEVELKFQQAKQMEKEQITDSYIEGHSIYGESTNAEQYYNETYGQTKN